MAPKVQILACLPEKLSRLSWHGKFSLSRSVTKPLIILLKLMLSSKPPQSINNITSTLLIYPQLRPYVFVPVEVTDHHFKSCVVLCNFQFLIFQRPLRGKFASTRRRTRTAALRPKVRGKGMATTLIFFSAISIPINRNLGTREWGKCPLFSM